MKIYRQVTPKFREQFFSLVEPNQNIVITCHFSPDDDAISSVLSLRYLLSQKYPHKKIKIIISGRSVDRFSSFKNYNQINFVSDVLEYIKSEPFPIQLDNIQFKQW